MHFTFTFLFYILVIKHTNNRYLGPVFIYHIFDACTLKIYKNTHKYSEITLNGHNV